MKRIKIFVADPTNKESLANLEAEWVKLLAAFPEATTTFLQSSATTGTEISGGRFQAQHVLSAIVKWDDTPPPAAGGSSSGPRAIATFVPRTRR